MVNPRKNIGVIGSYVLGAALFAGIPIAASAATFSGVTDSAGTTITATVNSVISITTSTNVAIDLTPTPGGVVSSSNDTVTVNTNNNAGYTLTLSNSDATTDLVSGGDLIPSHAGTQAAPTALANNTWGYRVVGVGGFGAGAYASELNNTTSTSTWAGVPAVGAENTLKTTASTATNDITTVWYGVRVNASQPNGIYSDTVTYTATTN